MFWQRLKYCTAWLLIVLIGCFTPGLSVYKHVCFQASKVDTHFFLPESDHCNDNSANTGNSCCKNLSNNKAVTCNLELPIDHSVKAFRSNCCAKSHEILQINNIFFSKSDIKLSLFAAVTLFKSFYALPALSSFWQLKLAHLQEKIPHLFGIELLRAYQVFLN